jgi:aspartyl-tRNA(Asn)/glutamyl-tRNA(Gln) amidotransferase subunit B
MHDSNLGTLIDCNRCGVPLIEIVSEPDIRSAEEACAYLKKLRTLMLYAGVSDCKMNEGSFRCDVNISVRKIGTTELGTRTEIKNLNSFQFVSKAIEFEYKRQVDALERGESIVQETRRFDEGSGETHSMRKKENAHDYRYFPEPDLKKIVLTDEEIDEYRSELPLLPDELKKTFISRYGLTSYDCDIITESPELADYFVKVVSSTEYPKLAANMLITDVLGNSEDVCIIPERLSHISDMLGKGQINSATAKKLIKELSINDFDVVSYVEENKLEQINDKIILTDILLKIIEANPKTVDDYKKGKTSALKSIIGQAMAKTNGRGNPVLINEIATELLSE